MEGEGVLGALLQRLDHSAEFTLQCISLASSFKVLAHLAGCGLGIKAIFAVPRKG
jgi:hypothetical protein